MNRIMASAMAACGLMFSAYAGAASDVDFSAGLNNYTVDGSVVERLVANANFTNVDLPALGSYTFEYVIHDCNDPANLLFDGTLTITNGQSRVSMGTPKTGKFTLSWDAGTQALHAKFILNTAAGGGCFNVVGGSTIDQQAWGGQIMVIRNHIVF